MAVENILKAELLSIAILFLHIREFFFRFERLFYIKYNVI